MIVATTDGGTSLHRPVFCVGLTFTPLNESLDGDDEHDEAIKARPAPITTAS